MQEQWEQRQQGIRQGQGKQGNDDDGGGGGGAGVVGIETGCMKTEILRGVVL